MATPAAPSIDRRYSAGDCTLSLTLQPSALSQWYPTPIADRVDFKLWMRTGEGLEPVLLAEGDRTDLQMIAQHVEHRTRAVLSVAQSRSRRDEASTLLSLPLGAHLPEPLSYLQLCDLSAVFNQYEAGAIALPVALDITPESAQAARTMSLEPRSSTVQQRPRKRGLLIPFGSARTAWASSAAVALFAVGLTSVIWNRSAVPDFSSVSESELANPSGSESSPSGLRLNRGDKNSQLSAGLPREDAERTGDPFQSNANQRLQTAKKNGQSSQSAEPPTPSGAVRQPRNPANSGSSSQTSSSAAPPAASEGLSAGESVAPANAGNRPSGRSRTRSESANSTTSANIPQAPPQTAARSSAAERPNPNNALDRQIARAEADADRQNGTASLSEAETFESESPATFDSAIPPSADAQTNAQSSAIASANQEAETITQVQNYFNRQSLSDATPQSPLTYRLQLSQFGEVVGFSALSEAGNAYRDRLLPDSNISFPPTSSAALANGLTLQVTLTPDGQVRVQKL